MKRTAFLQALVIVILLTGSWLLLVNRFREAPPPPVDESVQTAPDREESKSTETPAESPATESPQTEPEPVAPDVWTEWIQYLEEAGNPAMMRSALADLRETIFSMPRDRAVAWIRAFLDSGFDMRTGLAFQTGPDRWLQGAASLRALLLDWLHKLDPNLAAEIAVAELETIGTGLDPDVYVIHMRNYGASPSASDSRLDGYFAAILDQAEWINQPAAAIAEAMDIPVHTGNVAVAPELSRLMEHDRPQMLRHAAALAVERLIDGDPVPALSALLDYRESLDTLYKARAGYFARLDPALEGAAPVLEAYLSDPGISREEQVFFLRSFPNLNLSYSHSLLSTGIPDTEPGGYRDRYESALEQVRIWRTDPFMSGLETDLQELEDRLVHQLTGSPVP